MTKILRAAPRRKPISLLALVICLSASVTSGQAQTPSPPEREQLLNGLRILIWPRSGGSDLIIKLRIHSGAAFDLAGKSGEMVLLGDILFPNPETVEFFTEEMNGRLEVVTNYDSITITMQGRASGFERIIDILRNALVATQITPETVARVRQSRVKIVRDTAISPAIVADRAIAARLFGEFPYGRPISGSVEDLARVDRADLLLARERFLNANNATLTIAGGLDKSRAMKALRQLLGIWRRSEQLVPATFRLPEPPDARTLIINGPADQSAEVRLAVRGLARADADCAAATLLSIVARQRWQRLMPELANKPSFVRHEPHLLPGMFVMGAGVTNKSAVQAITAGRRVLDSLVKIPVTPAELEQARNEVIVQLGNQLAKPEGASDGWLDLDTYHLSSPEDQTEGLQRASVGDLQRVAARLFGERIASVVLGDAQQLKSELEGRVQIEVMGEIASPNSGQPQSKPVMAPGPTPKP